VQSWTSQSQQSQIISIFWLLGPVAAMLGNTASDIWLSVAAISLLAFSFYKKDWAWVKESWMVAALVFWAWLLFTASISQWPQNSLKEAVAFIRFPVFGMAFAIFVGNNPARFRFFVIVSLITILICMPVLLYQRIWEGTSGKLYGTWGQSLKFGWFVTGIGLPSAIYLTARSWKKQSKQLGAVSYAIVVIWLTMMTGDIYISLSAMLGLAVFILLAGVNLKFLIMISVGAVSSIVGLAFLSPELSGRFLEGLSNRLPWLPQSDYYDVWVAGLKTFLQNPVLGVGPDNYEAYCVLPGKLEGFGVEYCLNHPHQLYIQILAETGMIGLALMAIMVALLLSGCLKGYSIFKLPPAIAGAIALLTVSFWPISTYSNAFGQHKNFFTWLMVGVALALIQLHRNEQKKTAD
jgi:O-antigen ligase